MAGRDVIVMSTEEARRVSIINQAIEKLISQKKSAQGHRFIIQANKEAYGEDKRRRE